MKAIAGGIAGLLFLPVVFIGAAIGALGGTGGALPTAQALAAIPADILTLYQQAAPTCPGLSWTVLAAIGTVESNNGQSDAPGVHSGTNSAGAEGPMQFEPATFAAYDQPVPPGGAQPPSPYDPTDAVYAAARDLCANGGANPATTPDAVFAYNHDNGYVAQVLDLAAQYGTTDSAPNDTAAAAVTFALAQLGAPYRWGGDGPGGFDCSGLTQAAYASAAIGLPRVAQAQFDAGPTVAPGAALDVGDLVFFGSGPSAVAHVGLVVASGEMIDAPHAGDVVRIDTFPSTVGATWGAETFLGATRPWTTGQAPSAPPASRPPA